MSDTASRYPAGVDTNLKIPRTPSVARLSEAEAPQDYGYVGQNENSHSDLHHAENNSIQQMQRTMMPEFDSQSHDHSDPWNVDYSTDAYREHPSTKKGRNLRVRNTHVFSDNSKPTNAQESAPDVDLVGIHHSLGGDDNLGDYQAVSGSLWKKKHLPDVPDTMFQILNQLINEWPDDYIEYPGDNLKDVLIAIIKKVQSNENELKDLIDKLKQQMQDELDKMKEELEKEMQKNDGVINDVVNHIWGVTRNPDGSLSWPGNMKIVMGDLNVFSDANPNDGTTSNSLRSRPLSNADIKAQ